MPDREEYRLRGVHREIHMSYRAPEGMWDLSEGIWVSRTLLVPDALFSRGFPVEDFLREIAGAIVAGSSKDDEVWFHEDLDWKIRDKFTAAEHKEVIRTSSWINEKVFHKVANNPEFLRTVTPREFEEFVAELFAREGFDVELTPETRDGGKDIIAVRHGVCGPLKYVVECKKHRKDRPVGVELVRQLYGVVSDVEASCGVLATTSYFSPDAQQFAERHAWRLALRDFKAIKNWVTLQAT